jgi:ankyrin repeat protein
VQVERGVNVDYELRDGLTALMVAAREDQREAVKALLQVRGVARRSWGRRHAPGSRLL